VLLKIHKRGARPLTFNGMLETAIRAMSGETSYPFLLDKKISYILSKLKKEEKLIRTDMASPRFFLNETLY